MSKTMWIASLGGLKIPGTVLGQDDEKVIDPGVAVEVPVSYGTHLVEDCLAYEADVDEASEEPVGDEDGDAYSKMSKEELEDLAESMGYNPPGNIKEETLRGKVRKLVSDKFEELEAKAEELGIKADNDWSLEEYQAAIEEASK